MPGGRTSRTRPSLELPSPLAQSGRMIERSPVHSRTLPLNSGNTLISPANTRSSSHRVPDENKENKIFRTSMRNPVSPASTTVSPVASKIPPRISLQMEKYECLRTGKVLGKNYGDGVTSPKPQGSGIYVLGMELAQGAAGDVFAAVTVEDGSFVQVATKHVRLTSSSRRKHVINELEAALIAQKNGAHENVIKYLDWFPGADGVDREIFLVMERCDFGLDDIIRPVRDTRALYERRFLRGSLLGDNSTINPYTHRFAEKELGKLLSELTGALVYLNSLGIVHQDVKTENILWRRGDSETENGVYKLCDFGVMVIAKNIEENERSEVAPKGRPGTLWTMAPEVLRNQPRDSSCDIWSLGCVLYEVAFLDKPFNSIELLAYQNDPNAELPEIFPKRPPKPEVNTVSTPPLTQSKSMTPVSKLQRSPKKSPSLDSISGPKPVPRVRQKYIYSQALKNIINLCFILHGPDRMTPKVLFYSDAYEAMMDAMDEPCSATVTSQQFYKSSCRSSHNLNF